MPAFNSKYAWCELTPRDQSKRPAIERVADFLEIYGLYDEATAREQASRCIQCPEPACVAGCPLDNPMPEWLRLTAEGRFLEAAAVLRSALTLPELCLRACPSDRLCEGQCILNGKAEPVSIGAIEQFLHEYALAHGALAAAPVASSGCRVAVVGSGPGGLACADELSRRGHAVTVFAARWLPGGLLVNGIPAFVLQKTVVQRRIEMLKQQGVVFRLGVKIGQDISLGELHAGHDAVYLGFDATQARTLAVPGAELPGVVQAVPFIIHQNIDARLDVPPIEVAGQRVVVIGGGDTALDCLRTAVRCGAAEATGVYRRDEANLPCSHRDYVNTIEEGARFIFQATPVAVLGNQRGRVAGVRLCRTERGPEEAHGRPAFHPQAGTEFDLAADWVFLALGFEPLPFQHWTEFCHLPTSAWGGLVVNDQQMTAMPGVFAGGDLVRGPSLLMHSVRDARRAAAGIHDYLSAAMTR